MGQRIDLFKSSALGDKNQKREMPTGMGKKEKWKAKKSNVSYYNEQAIVAVNTGSFRISQNTGQNAEGGGGGID